MSGSDEGSAEKRERPDETEETDTSEPATKQLKTEIKVETEENGGSSEVAGEEIGTSKENAAEGEAKEVKSEDLNDVSVTEDPAAKKTESGAKESTPEGEQVSKSDATGSKKVTGTAPSTSTSKPLPTESTPAPAAPAPAPAPAPQPPSVQASSVAPAPAPAPSADQIVEERGEVSALYVGRVIGKGGEMIRDLQARSACRIDVDQNVPAGQPRVITYRGTRRTVDFAKRLVHMLCQENASETDLPLGEAKREFLVVPSQAVGKIIGRGGEMIRELQSRSQAKIQVDHSGNSGLDHSEKQVTITGTDQAVTKAREMVLFLVANPLMDAMQAINMLIEDKVHRGGVWGSGPPYVNLPNQGQNMQPTTGGYDQNQFYGNQNAAPTSYGAAAVAPYAAAPSPYGGAPPAYQQQAAQASFGQYNAGGGVEMEIFYAAKNYMGRIIGQKGVTINDLQRRSACDIQINQDVPPGQECEISIRGSRQGIETVKQMLREIIEIGPNHPYAGGNQGGAYQQPTGYGHQAAPAAAAPAAHHGYGGYQQDQYVDYGHGHSGHGAYDNQYSGPAHGRQMGYQAPQAQPTYGQTPQAAQYHQQAPHQQMYGGGGGGGPPQQAAMPGWKTATSPDGQVYYYNERTGETQWEKPPGMP